MHSSIIIDMMHTISFEMGGLTFDARNELRLQLPDPLASHQANEYDSPDPESLAVHHRPRRLSPYSHHRRRQIGFIAKAQVHFQSPMYTSCSCCVIGRDERTSDA
jgi:hypothetical protein